MKKYHKIRARIAELSKLQTELKPQRKTIHFKGDREMDASVASMAVNDNRFELRHLYHAYAKMKGIELPNPKRVILMDSIINKFTVDFAPEEVAEESAA